MSELVRQAGVQLEQGEGCPLGRGWFVLRRDGSRNRDGNIEEVTVQ